MDRIMLIDSSEQSSQFIIRCLTKSGYDVLHITDGSSAALQVKAAAIDLIIIDSDLNSESGFDVCRKLKTLEETQYTLVLIMGESDSTNSLARALESGADDYMLKDFDENALKSKVASLLRIKDLSDQLKERYTELEQKNKILDMQLSMAMNVQRSLIKEYNFMHNGVRFVSKYMPALDIGGDFYDIIKLDDENVAVVMGDVSGHGISAALLTAMINMMARNLAPKYYNPAQFLFHMNNEFAQIFANSESQMYACMFYAIINTNKKRIYYSNAGQALPIHVVSAEAGAVELEASGAPIGMLKDSVYEHKIALYGEGDLILFYTDGLADNLYKDKADEFYSRIESLLLGMRKDSDPEILLDALIGAFYNVNAAKNKKMEMDDVSVILCSM